MHRERPAVTVRSVLFGLAVAVIVNIWITEAEYVIHASRMNLSHFPVALLAVYVLAVSLMRRAQFTSAETATVIAMGLVASAVPTSGLMGFWLGSMATPYYFATPENRWAEIFHPHIPSWLVPRDTDHAIEWFYNGLPPGEVANWHAWVVPVFWWLSLIAAIILLSICIAAVLRKPWVENERLVFPIAEVGMALGQGDTGGGGVSSGLRRRLFRIGFAVAFGIFAWNSIGFFDSGWPAIALNYGAFSLFPGFAWFALRFNLLTLGLCYHANTAALLSLWSFFLIIGLQHMVFGRLGYTVGAMGDDWSSIDPMAAWEGFGAMTALVLWGLWTARDHLRHVAKAAVRGGPLNHDQNELLSFRVAVFAGLASLAYVVSWLHVAGMEWTMAIAWTSATLIIFVGIARIVSETGLPYVRGPLTAQSFAAYGLGTAEYSGASITMLTFTYAFISQGKGLFMAPFMQAAKLASEVRSARRIVTAVVAAMVIGILVCLLITIVMGYSMGAFNFRDYPFSAAGRHMFGLTSKYVNDPLPAAWDRWMFFGIGAGAFMLLSLLRSRFYWWPLAPIGMTIATTYATLNSVLMVFVAWLAKSIVLHIGGVALYNKSKPLFLGLACGYAVGVGYSFLVDWIWFPGVRHYVHSW
jgi:hypothetical protein